MRGGVVSTSKRRLSLRRRQRLTGRVRGRVRGNHFHGVAAIGQQAGVEGIGLVGEVVFEQKPARSRRRRGSRWSRPVDRRSRRARSTSRRWNRDRASWSRGASKCVRAEEMPGIRYQAVAAAFRWRLILHADLHRYVVDFGSDIFGQVIERHAVDEQAAWLPACSTAFHWA